MATFHYRVQDEQVAVQIERDGHDYHVTIEDRKYTVSLYRQDDHQIKFSTNGQRQQVAFAHGTSSAERQHWFNVHTRLLEKKYPTLKLT